MIYLQEGVITQHFHRGIYAFRQLLPFPMVQLLTKVHFPSLPFLLSSLNPGPFLFFCWYLHFHTVRLQPMTLPSPLLFQGEEVPFELESIGLKF